jgi:hypothetical protein
MFSSNKLKFIQNKFSLSLYPRYTHPFLLMGKFNFKNFKTGAVAEKPSELPKQPTPQAPSQTPPAQSPPTQVAKPAEKTKEELKVEKLMSQWPEYIRNPPKGNIKANDVKNRLEQTYKFHQGDKKYLSKYDLPISIFQESQTFGHNLYLADATSQYFNDFEGFITDHDIMKSFAQNCLFNDVCKEFFDTVLPRVKQLVLKADRQCNNTLHLAVVGAAAVDLGDKEFWDMIVYYI